MNHKAERTRSSLGRLLLILAMTIALVAGTALIGAQGAKAAGDNDSGSTTSDIVKKTVTDNKDGSYTLTLSATGKSESDTSTVTTPTDVVLVIDNSNSMYYDPIDYTPSSNQNNVYGTTYNGEYYKLTYNRRGGYWSIRINGQDHNYNNWVRDYGYSFYLSNNRMTTAKDSAKSLVETLTSKGKNVQVSVVSFGTKAKIEQGLTNNSNNLNTAIDSININGGTNWEDGLAEARDVLKGSKATNKYVIFLSDGNPTYRNSQYSNRAKDNGYYDYYGNWHDNDYGVWGTGNSDPNSWNFNAANDVAESIRKSGTKLYNINIFGDADNMKNLSNDGYYEANDASELNKVFEEIIKSTSNSMDVKRIVVHDTLTDLTASSVTTGYADGTRGSFVYQATYKDGDEEKTVTADNDRKVSYTTSDKKTHTYIIPEASIGDDGKTINWTPGDDVPSGVTYSVSCTIWPKKEAYQQVAKKMNGESVTLDSQITGNNTNGYSMATNAASYAAYDEIHTTTQTNPEDGINGLTKNDDGTYTYNGITFKGSGSSYTATDGSTLKKDSDGKWTLDIKKTLNRLGNGSMKIEPAQINVTKEWKNVSASDKPDSITVKAESTTEGDSTSYTKTISGDKSNNTWTGTIYVAPGLTRSSDSKVLNASTTYQIKETGMDAGEYSTTYTPGNPSYTPVNNGLTVADPYNVTITNTKIIKTGIRTENRAPFTAAVIGLGALAVVFVLRRRFVHR